MLTRGTHSIISHFLTFSCVPMQQKVCKIEIFITVAFEYCIHYHSFCCITVELNNCICAHDILCYQLQGNAFHIEKLYLLQQPIEISGSIKTKVITKFIVTAHISISV